MVKRFPEGFLWGTAISAFQCEMGRGPPSDKTDWWAWVHDPKNIARKTVSGDTPQDGPGFWELYAQDFQLAREGLGNNSIRIAVDWGRLFPDPVDDVEVEVKRDEEGYPYRVEVTSRTLEELERRVDQTSAERYEEIFREAAKQGLTLMLTLYHWPLPLWIHDPIECRDNLEDAHAKGWLDPNTAVEFAKFSAYMAHRYQDLVDLYCTLNEPRVVSEHGYLSPRGEFPPGLNDPHLFLEAMKNLALAHGLSYEQVKRWDHESLSPLGPSTVGLVAVLQVFEPYEAGNPLDRRAAQAVEYAFNEWGLNAVFRGDYDMDFNQTVEPWEQKPLTVKGCDYLGVNYYSRWKIRHTGGEGHPLSAFQIMPCEGDCSDYGWEIYPQGIRAVTRWAYQRYRRPIYITENGIADASGETRDRYLLSHLEELHKAITQDHVPVRGYFYWTLMDNFEWSDGYQPQFGLYKVEKETRKRLPTKTVATYNRIATTNGLCEKPS